MRYSFVISCYNSTTVLREIFGGIEDFLSTEGCFGEIILIDDASQQTIDLAELCRGFEKKLKITRYHLAQNYGQQKAVLFGMSKTKGDVVFTLDDDGEHDLRLLKPISQELKENALVIVGYSNSKRHFIRKLGTWVVARLAGRRPNVPANFHFSSYRGIHGELARKTAKNFSPHPIVGFELMKHTRRVSNLLVENKLPSSRQSSYSGTKLVQLFLSSVLFDFEFIKRLVFISSVIFMLLFVGFFSLVLLSALSSSPSPPGFYSIASLICLGFSISLALINVVFRMLTNSQVIKLSADDINCDFYEVCPDITAKDS